MKHETKLNSQRQHENAAEHQSRQQGATKFAGVEEMLRADALHTLVPPRLADRLQHSSADCPRPARSWWQRFFGGRS